MRLFISAALLAATLCTALPGRIEAGVTISVGEPHFYGRIDIGGYPPPRLVYEQPVVVRRVKVWNPPVYLRVPPAHRDSWYRYCGEYEACGRPVYFVDDDWYREVYVPRYREYRPEPRFYRQPPPAYYEYRSRRYHPPKRVYMREEYREDRRYDRNRRESYPDRR